MHVRYVRVCPFRGVVLFVARMMYREINSDKLCLHYEQVKAPRRDAPRYVAPVAPVSVNLQPSRGAELQRAVNPSVMINSSGSARCRFFRQLLADRLAIKAE